MIATWPMGVTSVLLPRWLVQDGEIPEFAVGGRLYAGLELSCWERRVLTEPAPPSVGGVAGSDPQGFTGGLHELVGTVRWRGHNHAGWLIAIDDLLVSVNEVPAETVPSAGEQPPMSPPEVGDHVWVRGTLMVAADYVWRLLTSRLANPPGMIADEGTTDGRRHWIVERIVLHQAGRLRGPNGVFYPDPATHQERDLRSISRWDDGEDEPVISAYGLDLRTPAEPVCDQAP